MTVYLLWDNSYAMKGEKAELVGVYDSFDAAWRGAREDCGGDFLEDYDVESREVLT